MMRKRIIPWIAIAISIAAILISLTSWTLMLTGWVCIGMSVVLGVCGSFYWERYRKQIEKDLLNEYGEEVYRYMQAVKLRSIRGGSKS